MRTLTAFEAKTRFGELLERVARGEEIIITRHDRPVARVVPEGRRSLDATRAAVARLGAVRARIAKRSRGKSRVTDADVRAAIEDGRR